jgi:hypothetical protein
MIEYTMVTEVEEELEKRVDGEVVDTPVYMVA